MEWNKLFTLPLIVEEKRTYYRFRDLEKLAQEGKKLPVLEDNTLRKSNSDHVSFNSPGDC